MQGNSIRSLIKTPGLKIIRMKKTAGRKDVYLEAYKRLAMTCSGCGKKHTEGFHSTKWAQAEDLRLGDMKVFLHIKKRRHRCLWIIVFTQKPLNGLKKERE